VTSKRTGKAIGWSIAFLVSGILLSVSLYSALASVVTPAGSFLLAALLQSVAMLAAFGAATWAIGLRGAGLTPGDLRWAPVRIGLPSLGRGVLLGLVPAAVAMTAAVVLGGAAWSHDGGSAGEWLAASLQTGAVLLPAALAEEVIFRGVPLVLLAGLIGRWKAAVLLSVLFAMAHLLNPGVTGLALANIALAGVFLSACFYLPGGLWIATGAHLGWNLGLAALAAPVSGVPLVMPMLDYEPGGPDWLTGAAFGPEGGILATLVFAGVTAMVVRQVRNGRQG